MKKIASRINQITLGVIMVFLGTLFSLYLIGPEPGDSYSPILQALMPPPAEYSGTSYSDNPAVEATQPVDPTYNPENVDMQLEGGYSDFRVE